MRRLPGGVATGGAEEPVEQGGVVGHRNGRTEEAVDPAALKCRTMPRTASSPGPSYPAGCAAARQSSPRLAASPEGPPSSGRLRAAAVKAGRPDVRSSAKTSPGGGTHRGGTVGVMADVRVTRAQVLAFRAAAQALDRRRPASELLDIAGACGVQDTPPGNADVSLAARLDLDGPVVEKAVAAKELVLTWSVRGAPHVLPPVDLPVFTLGARPADGTGERLWGEPEHALVEVERAMVEVLADGPRSKGDLSTAVTAAVPAELAPWCAACKVNHPRESVFRAAPLVGRLVLTSTAPVVLARADTWLGADARGDVAALRAELLRRYLHCYAPTTPGHFAEWAGITSSDAKERWTAVADEVVRVAGDGKGFVLERDADALLRPPPSAGVRLIPAKDAFLQARDRGLLFPDPAHRKAVFPTLGGPGVVLHEAVPVGTWRGAAKAGRHEVTVAPFTTLTKGVWREMEAEARRVARVRGRENVQIAVG